MLVDNTLFMLLLAAVTLVIIVMFTLVANLLIESKQRQKTQLSPIVEATRNTQHKCAYSYGHLSSLSRRQPIPDECFGCTLAIDCIKANPKLTKQKTDKPSRQKEIEPEQTAL